MRWSGRKRFSCSSVLSWEDMWERLCAASLPLCRLCSGCAGARREGCRHDKLPAHCRGHLYPRERRLVMSNVFVLNADKTPLNPVHPGRARLLLTQGKAAVFRHYPFTIIMTEEVQQPEIEPLRLKIDPGSKAT